MNSWPKQRPEWHYPLAALLSLIISMSFLSVMVELNKYRSLTPKTHQILR